MKYEQIKKEWAAWLRKRRAGDTRDIVWSDTECACGHTNQAVCNCKGICTKDQDCELHMGDCSL